MRQTFICRRGVDGVGCRSKKTSSKPRDLSTSRGVDLLWGGGGGGEGQGVTEVEGAVCRRG